MASRGVDAAFEEEGAEWDQAGDDEGTEGDGVHVHELAVEGGDQHDGGEYGAHR